MATIGVIGGTGHLGKAIARRLSKAGHAVTIGSRDPDKAQTVAAELAGDGMTVAWGSNAEIAAGKEVLIVTVPYSAQVATLTEIRPFVGGAIVVDTTVPLVPPKVMRVQMPPEGSAGRRAQNALGPDVRVVSAFQNVSADHLQTIDHAVVGEVLVAGDDKAARETVIELAAAIGIKAWHAGALDNAAVAEALTSVLIFMNKTYGMDGAGIQLVAPDKH